MASFEAFLGVPDPQKTYIFLRFLTIFEVGPSWPKLLIFSLMLGHLGVILGPLGAVLGPFWGPLGALLAPFWALSGLSVAILGHLGALWCALGAILGHIGAILGHLGHCVGQLGAILASFVAFLGPFWGRLGPSRGRFWDIWEPISVILDQSSGPVRSITYPICVSILVQHSPNIVIILTSLAHSFPKRLQASRPQALEGPRRGREALTICLPGSTALATQIGSVQISSNFLRG